MIKATGNETCSRCHGGVSKGEDLMEGGAGTDDSGCLYHPDCYSDLCREESGEGKECSHAWEPLTLSPERYHRRRCKSCGTIEVYAPRARGRHGWHWLDPKRVSTVAADNPRPASLQACTRWRQEKPGLAKSMGIGRVTP